MVIGVDLDGVVYDSERLLKYRSELIDLEIQGKGLVNSDSWCCVSRHEWGKEVAERFANIERPYACMNANLMPGAKEVLKMLKQEGHTIIFITGRINDEVIATKIRLKRDKLSYDKIIFVSGSKLKTCCDEKIDIMIDDKPATAEELSNNGINTLYFREAELPHIRNEKAIEVYNWGQIYRLIKTGKFD